MLITFYNEEQKVKSAFDKPKQGRNFQFWFDRGGDILDTRALLSCAWLYAATGFEGSGDEIGVVTHCKKLTPRGATHRCLIRGGFSLSPAPDPFTCHIWQKRYYFLISIASIEKWCHFHIPTLCSNSYHYFYEAFDKLNWFYHKMCWCET